jgi:hypothetical protein
MPRLRNCPYIHKLRDAIIFQNRNKLVERMRRMPDGENRLPSASLNRVGPLGGVADGL